MFRPELSFCLRILTFVRHEPIQSNKITDYFNKGIVVPSFIFIVSVSLIASFFPNVSERLLENVKQFLFVNLNWLYVMAVTVFVLFLIFLVFSKYGKIRLGPNDSKPEYSFFSWVSMLFAAGMGIGLMYFSVSEPIAHYSDAVFAGNSEVQRAKDAQLFTFFHWGIHAWAIYGVVGLSLAYFAYRYKLPLSLRSCFYPMLKDRINGRVGNLIDMFALCSTFFGITTSLGFGVMQLSAGLAHLGVLPGTGFIYQIGIVFFVMLLSILSATSGVSRGVKRLSQINIVTAVVLMLFVLLTGPTVYLLGTFSEGLGYYINEFFSLTFAEMAVGFLGQSSGAAGIGIAQCRGITIVAGNDPYYRVAVRCYYAVFLL